MDQNADLSSLWQEKPSSSPMQTVFSWKGKSNSSPTKRKAIWKTGFQWQTDFQQGKTSRQVWQGSKTQGLSAFAAFKTDYIADSQEVLEALYNNNAKDGNESNEDNLQAFWGMVGFLKE
jgi:hypothetical protein